MVMKFNPIKCEVVMIANSEIKPSYEYLIARKNVLKSTCEREFMIGIVLSLSPVNRIRIVVKE